MFDRRYDPIFLKGIFEQTRILRRPISGIVSGYHVLPYILVGPDTETECRAVEVRGKIRVSPRLVIRPGEEGQTYGEVFGESETMDRVLVGRLFAFRYAARRHALVESEDLTIRPAEGDPEARIERILVRRHLSSASIERLRARLAFDLSHQDAARRLTPRG